MRYSVNQQGCVDIYADANDLAALSQPVLNSIVVGAKYPVLLLDATDPCVDHANINAGFFYARASVVKKSSDGIELSIELRNANPKFQRYISRVIENSYTLGTNQWTFRFISQVQFQTGNCDVKTKRDSLMLLQFAPTHIPLCFKKRGSK